MINRIKISYFLNIVIVVFTVLATVIMFSGYEFMPSEYAPVLTSSKIGMFKFFTVDSNLLMGISALLFLIYESKLINKKIENIPEKLYVLKLVATTAVSVTFLVVFAYLGPISKGGITSMLLNSNLFFHLLIPVLSIISFVFFEKTSNIGFKKTIYGLLPTILYSLYYVTNIVFHLQNGKVSATYDFYYFIQGGIADAFIVAPIMLLMAYIICLLLWKLNRVNAHE